MTVEHYQQFSGSILFRAGIMFGRRTPLVPIPGNITAAVHENNILQPIVNGFAETVGEGLILPHRSQNVQRFFVGVESKEWIGQYVHWI